MRRSWWSALVFALVIATGAAAESDPAPPPPAGTPAPAAPQATDDHAAGDQTAEPAQESQAPPAAEPSNEKPPEQPPAEKPAENPPPPSPPATASVLDKRLIQGVLGKDVRSSNSEDMGRIVDVIVDRSGQTRGAVIDFGGFLGVGSRRIAVDWNALHFAPEDKGSQITLDLTRDQLKAAPEYKEGKPVVVLGPSGNTETVPEN